LGNSHFFISSGFSEDFGVQLMRARSFSPLPAFLINFSLDRLIPNRHDGAAVAFGLSGFVLPIPMES
jgi:hypothetical protein